jgi:protein TonB
MNFSPEPPAPFARESREPEPLPLPIRTEDEPVRFDPDRPAVVVAAEALPEDPIPPEVLVMRIGPSGPPASRPPAPETAVDTVTEPSPSSPIRIDYPRLARQRGMEGAVTLEVSVDAEGAVATIRVAESSGHAILDEAAVRGLERVTFEPARRNGIPVPWTFRQTVRFSLR